MSAPPDASRPPSEEPPRWARHPLALWRRSGDRIVVLCPDQDEPLLLTGTGQALWEVLEEPTTTEELVTIMAAVTASSRDGIAGPVHDLLVELASEQAVQRT